MKDRKIIGFAGRMRSGKTILANAISQDYNGSVVTIASSLKNLVLEAFPRICSSMEELNRLKNSCIPINYVITDLDVKLLSKLTNINIEDVKHECQIKECWLDVRDMLQFIGTNIIRKYNPNWHVERLIENINRCNSDVVLVDDVRFPNEREAIERVGGDVFFIIRTQSRIFTNHSAETSLKWQDFNPKNVIINNRDENTLTTNFANALTDNFRWLQENDTFLSGNPEYFSDNTDFGYIIHKDDVDLIREIVSQNKDVESFMDEGIIHYDTVSDVKANEFNNKVKKQAKTIYNGGHKFIVYNPLIYENLKSQL